MRIRRLTSDDVPRFVEDLWLPFHRELAAVTGTYELADDVDLVATETEYRRERFADDDQRTWVAVDSRPTSADGSAFVGFLTAEPSAAPSVFERPDRVTVNDVFVHESHRGTGLADELLARAADWADELGYGEVSLTVHVDNDRARAFYEKHGFETLRERRVADVDDI